MPEIRKDGGIVTQITTVKVEPEHQAEVLKLMTERARFMAKQPGFVSVSLHRSADTLSAAHHSPEFRKRWPRFSELAQEIEPCLYEVVHIEGR